MAAVGWRKLRGYAVPVPIASLAVVILMLVRPIDGPSATRSAPDGVEAAESGSAPRSAASVPGLTKPVSINFDAVDVPTIVASNEADAARALGFAHATARFAQMDMMRRFSAGETAELLGEKAVPADLERRALRGRATARACVERLDARKRVILDAYVQGVNAGIEALPALPIEHMLLGITPAPWKPEDCALVYLSMFHSLSRTGRADAVFAEALERLPRPVCDFIASPISRLDCPVIAETAPPVFPAIPGVDAIDLRSMDRAAIEPPAKEREEGAPKNPPKNPPKKEKSGAKKPKQQPTTPVSGLGWTDALAELWNDRAALAGSNGWVVAGSRTKDGRAILASDPHLMITAPILWYRCRLEWPGVEWTGLSIPGVPGIVVGGNGHVAVGFTNTTGDFEDIALIDVDPKDPSRYRIPGGGSEAFGSEEHTILVRGKDPERVVQRTTRWGTVTGEMQCADGVTRPFVTLWIGSRPDAINFEVLDMARVRTVDEAADLLSNWYGPSQNAMLADRAGDIAWVVTGWIPDRRGHDPRLPWRPSVDGDPWQGPVDPALRPKLVRPSSGVIVTANHRTVPIEQCAMMGHYWANPERAHRIHELLSESEPLDESRMLAIQLDTKLEGLEPYRALALAALEGATDPALIARRESIAAWNGRADADQPAVALLSAFQRSIERRFALMLMSWVRAQSGESLPGLAIRSVNDEPWLRVLESRPPNWLPAGYADWNDFTLAALAEAAAKEPGVEPWGERNRARFASPVADAVPAFMKPTVTLDDGPQPGHARAVRVQTPRAAASARYIVSPGREADGILETPGGQSGDPRSPHYRSLHQAWRNGEPTPLLPGPAARSIVLDAPK
ncbi:MAG: penicillin acylase family protein [Phycisphaerae bacterium]|nr:penicillin acylase family protein [Phycisphaerae bacterium]